MPLDPAKQVDALLQLYRNIHSETLRYRDLEWKVTVWVVTLLAAISASFKWLPKSFDVQTRLVVVLVVGFVCAYGLWHLLYVHLRLTQTRNQCRKCENLLGLYEPAPVWPHPVSPDEGKPVGYCKGWPHLVSFALTIVGATLFAIAIVWNWK
jgi:uncharacterized membrane protein YciS (DUF1049 family)